MTCISIFLASAIAATGAPGGFAASQTPGPVAPALHLAFKAGAKPTGNLNKCWVNLTIENRGAGALLLNLGTMLANGKKLLPTAIVLELKNSTGKTVKLQYGGGEPGIAGRADDFIVGLVPGASYSLRLQIASFRPEGGSEPLKALANGAYSLTAVYVGASATHVNSDMEGISTLNLWQGTSRSKGLPFKVAGSAAPAAGGG